MITKYKIQQNQSKVYKSKILSKIIIERRWIYLKEKPLSISRKTKEETINMGDILSKFRDEKPDEQKEVKKDEPSTNDAGSSKVKLDKWM